MFGWFRRGPARPETALAMIGARASDDVLFLGAKDLTLAAETGAVTRLNGRTVIVGAGADTATRIERAAEKAGGILEFVDAPFARLPFDAATFHIVVAPEMTVWTGSSVSIAEASRVLRPGGRIILIAGKPNAPSAEAVVAMLTTSGFVAARKLAEADGVVYYEARKTREVT